MLLVSFIMKAETPQRVSLRRFCCFIIRLFGWQTILARRDVYVRDAELCAVVMNIMDNALEAAAAPGVARQYIKLDLHIRNSFLAFICETGATPDWVRKKTAPERGLGLKVIRQIVERHGNLSQTEYGDGCYRVTVARPFHQPLK